METMALGTFTAGMLIVLFCFLYCKKAFLGCVSGMIALYLTGCTGYHWKLMLTESGKDTAFLGFERYPAVPVILGILAFSAAVGIIVSGIMIVRKHRNE